jgi:hypothetical protein
MNNQSMRRVLVRLAAGAAGAGVMLLATAGAAMATTVPGSHRAVAGVPATAVTGHVAKPNPNPPADAWDPTTGPKITPKPPPTPGTAVAPLAAWTVSISASSRYLWATQYTTLTATANQDVGPTPYWLSIYDGLDHTYIAICGSGTTCSVSLTRSTPEQRYYTAFVSGYPTQGTAPPPNSQAWAPEVLMVHWHGAEIVLSVDLPTRPLGGLAVLTASAFTYFGGNPVDIGPSPLWLEIFDATAGSRASVCGSGTSCTATVSQSAATTHRYIAYLSHNTTAYPPTGIVNTSGFNFVTWTTTGWNVALTASPIFTAAYQPVLLTATTNRDVGPTPHYIQIFDEDGTRVYVCGAGTSCSFSYTPRADGINRLVAFVSAFDGVLPPANIQATSNVVTIYNSVAN